MTEAVLIIRLQDPSSIATRALEYAQAHDERLSVLLIMDSHLYHYGHSDVVVPGLARTRFLTHVLDQVTAAGRQRAEEIISAATARGVAVEIKPILEENYLPLLQQALLRGSGPIFVAKARRRRFPLLEKDQVFAALKKSEREVIAL
jgi:hypothetical protein